MILMVLVGAHLVADFMLQSSSMAEKKAKSLRVLVLHSIVYLIGIAVACFVSMNANRVMWPILILSLSHFIIDGVRIQIKKKPFTLFLVDQALHMGVLLLVFLLFDLQSSTGSLLQRAVDTWSQEEVVWALTIALSYIITLQPTAVLVKKVLKAMVEKHNNGHSDKPSNRAGYIIGMLERVLVVTLILVGQWAVIGFVLAAKSLARFKQLEDKEFAEIYLVGTLLSVIIAVLCTLGLQCIHSYF